jgi:hypothetical protein
MGLDDIEVLWQMGVGAEDWSDNQLKMALGKDGLEYASFLVFDTRTYTHPHTFQSSFPNQLLTEAEAKKKSGHVFDTTFRVLLNRRHCRGRSKGDRRGSKKGCVPHFPLY